MKLRKLPRPKPRQCTQCRIKFSSVFCFNLHSYVHKSRKNAWFPCHVCGRKFSQVARLLGHRVIHPLPKPKRKQQKKHLARRRISKKSKIEQSSQDENSAENNLLYGQVEVKEEEIDTSEDVKQELEFPSRPLNHHVEDDFGENNVFARFELIILDKDDKCDSQSVPNEDLQVDIISSSNLNKKNADHPTQSSLFGNMCNESGLQKSIATDHLYNCNDCGKSFTREVARTKHWELTHMGSFVKNMLGTSQEDDSNECKKSVPSVKHATPQQENCNSEKGNFLCHKCGKSFSWRRSLPRHAKVCPGNKSKKISKGYKSKTIAIEDKSANSGASNDVPVIPQSVSVLVERSCLQGEHMSSTSTSGTNHPKKMIDPISDFILVHEGYGRKLKLDQVMDLSGPSKGYNPCTLCDKVFVFKASLKHHSRIHTGETPYQCKICKSRFVVRKNCRRHIAKAHSEAISKPTDIVPLTNGTAVSVNILALDEPERVNSKDAPLESSSDESQNVSPQVEDTLSESEVQKILGDEDIFARRRRKANFNYFAGFSDGVGGKKSDVQKPKDDLVKKSLRSKKVRDGTSYSKVNGKASRKSGNKNKLVQQCLGMRESSSSASSDDEASTEPIKRVSNRKKQPTSRTSSNHNKSGRSGTAAASGESDGPSSNEKEASEWSAFSSDHSDMSSSEGTSDSEFVSPSKQRSSKKKAVNPKKSNYSSLKDDTDFALNNKLRLNNTSQEEAFEDEDYSPLHKPFSRKKNISEANKAGDELPFQCKVCKTKFANKYVLKRHEVRKGHSDESYKCSYCDRTYSNMNAYINHMYVHEDEDEMVCKICNKQLQSLTTYNAHQRMHQNNPFKCSLCKEMFPSDVKLEEHYAKAHDEEKEYKCKYCSKTFDWRANYIRHLNKHTNVKQFVCGICNYSFNISSNLGRHIRQAHRGEVPKHLIAKQWLKEKGNDSVLASPQKLQQHEIEEADCSDRFESPIPRSTKKHACTKCGKVCATKTGLSFHLRYAHDDARNASTKTALIHYVIENETFVCQMCGSTISTRGGVLHHLRTVHSLMPTDENIVGVLTEEGQKPPRIKSRTINYETIKKNLSHKRKYGEEFLSDTNCRSENEKSLLTKITAKQTRTGPARKIYPCQHCSAEFFQETNLTIHLKNSHYSTVKQLPGKESTFKPDIKCPLCSRKSASKDKLKNHLNTFHKIPEGLEDALIGLTSSVNPNSDDKLSNKERKRDSNGARKDSSGAKRDSNGARKDSSGAKRDSNGAKNDSSGAKRDSNGARGDCSGARKDFSEDRRGASEASGDNDYSSASSCETRDVLRRSDDGHRNPKNKDERSFNCPICGKHFRSVKLLQDHASICESFVGSDEEEMRRGDCSLDANASKSPLKDSPQNNAGDRSKKNTVYHCDICDIDFYHTHALNRHKLFSPAHSKIGQLKCPACKKVILAKDFQSHPCTGQMLRCTICDVCFSSKNSLKRHIKCVHSDQKEFRCDKCDKYFNRRTNLAQHQLKCADGKYK